MEAEPNKALEVEHLGFIVTPRIDLSYLRFFMGINSFVKKNPIKFGSWCNIYVILLKTSSD